MFTLFIQIKIFFSYLLLLRLVWSLLDLATWERAFILELVEGKFLEDNNLELFNTFKLIIWGLDVVLETLSEPLGKLEGKFVEDINLDLFSAFELVNWGTVILLDTLLELRDDEQVASGVSSSSVSEALELRCDESLLFDILII